MTAIDRPIGDIAAAFDMGDPKWADDPYPVYARLRDECPVAHSDVYGGYWILSRYDDVHFACQHPEIFSSYPNPIPASLGATGPLIPLEIDPPDHAKYRQILAPLFAPARIDALEPDVRLTINELLDAFAARGRCEFVSELAKPLPSIMFLRMMGWPQQDAGIFLEWTDKIVHGVPGDPEASQQVREECGMALYAYFAEILDARTEERQDDIVSILLDASFGGERPLNQFEILDIIFLLLIAGLDTTTSTLANAMVFLAEHPDHRQQIIDDPAIIPHAVEELLRLESPIGPGRRLTQDFTMHGIEMKKDDRVLLLMGATGRDATEFPDADEVKFSRYPNRHLAFGGGAHRCLGSYLGRLELRVALEEIHLRIPDYRIVPGTRPVRRLSNVRGTDELQLEFTPSAPGRVGADLEERDSR